MKVIGHVVVKGELLEKVADKLNVSVEKYIRIISPYFFGKRVSTHSIRKSGKAYEITYFA